MLGLKKIGLELGMGRQDPAKMASNLGSQELFLKPKLASILGGGLGGSWAPQASFLEPLLDPPPDPPNFGHYPF